MFPPTSTPSKAENGSCRDDDRGSESRCLRHMMHLARFRVPRQVRDILKNKSSLKSKADWVTVLDGHQEGIYQWVTINYLLGNLGKKHSSTVGVVDLGGGSVQMAYAISESDAAKAPKLSGGEDSYMHEMYLKRRKYHLYVHRSLVLNVVTS